MCPGRSVPVRRAWRRLMLMLVLVLATALGWTAASASAQQRVLLLYSYHPGFPTSPKILAGVREGLGQPLPEIEIEYMDSKRVFDATSRELFLRQFEYKLGKRPAYDLVITSDDNALTFMLEHGSRLLPNVPLVFLGVNNIGLALSQNGRHGITGVVEAASFRDTLALIAETLPRRGNVHILADDTPSGQADLVSVSRLTGDFPMLNFAVISLQELSWSQYAERLRLLGEADSLLLLSAYRDRGGLAMSYAEALALIRANTGAPIWHLWEHGLGEGVLGGVMVSHHEHGRRAGVMARRILNGTPAAAIPVLRESPNLTMFDGRLLPEYGIRADDLAPEVRVLFQPQTLWHRYREEIIVGGLLLVLLLVYVVSLRFQMAIRQRLTGEIATREARLRTLVEAIPDLVWMKDARGLYQACNRRFESLVGADESQIRGRSNEAFQPLLAARRYRESDKRVMRSDGPETSEQEVVFASDGHREVLEVIKTPVRDSDGKVIGVLGIGRDISERKRAEAEKQQLIDHMTERMREQRCMYAVTQAAHAATDVESLLEAVVGLLPSGWPHPEDTRVRIHYAGSDHGDRDFEPTRWSLVTELVSGGQTLGRIEVWYTREFPPRDLGPFSQEQRALLEGVAHAVTEAIARLRAEQQIRTLSQAMEQSPVCVVITDAQARIEYVNAAFETITGYSKDEVLGRNPSLLASGQTDRQCYVDLWAALGEGRSWQGEFINRRKHGELYWERVHIAPVLAANGQVAHYLAVKTDVTEHKRQEERILYQAHYDNLTGLPNRLLAMDRLAQMLKEARRSGCRAAILFLDLDDFKKVNDSLGHEVGDALLVQAARRLQASLRDSDTVGRLGGDEFVVLLNDLSGPADAVPVIHALLERFRKPFELDGREVVLTLSLGAAFYPQDGVTPAELLRAGDIAMYHSKDSGRNTYNFFNTRMNEEVSRRLSIEEQLRGALQRRELQVHYQPIVRLSDRRVVGAEALLRWTNPVLGAVSPDLFIPVAERTGLIVEIGRYVLQTAIEMAAAWRRDDLEDFAISVNVSPRQFFDPTLVAQVQSLLGLAGLPAGALTLEVTEGVLMAKNAGVDRALRALNSLGVRISMDDFGTGYSSLSYLRNYPFNSLKIDRSFVRDMTDDKADLELVNAIVVMADRLEIDVVAEGVETEVQFDALRELGCTYGQGYLISRPLPADDFGALLRELRDGIDAPRSAQVASRPSR